MTYFVVSVWGLESLFQCSAETFNSAEPVHWKLDLFCWFSQGPCQVLDYN